MTELYDTVYNPRIAIVEGMIYSGTYLFVGASKIGKSFFMAQLGYHVAKGIPLWDTPVNQGTVLYLALEDDLARIQSRLYKMFDDRDTPDLHFAVRAKTLSEGLIGQITEFVENYPKTRLIIVDTFQKVRDAQLDNYNYGMDYKVMTMVKEFTDSRNVCVMFVHHTRKQDAGDCFDLVSGTTGLMGAADATFIAKKNRMEGTITLNLTGRDQMDQQLEIKMNPATCIWELQKPKAVLPKDPPNEILEAVASFVADGHEEWKGTASALLAALGEMNIQPNYLTRTLNLNTTKLFQEYGIWYYHAKRSSTEKLLGLKRIDLKARSLDDDDMTVNDGNTAHSPGTETSSLSSLIDTNKEDTE